MILYPKILYHTEGKPIRIPGLPVMYDYEFHPQKVWLTVFELTEPILNECLGLHGWTRLQTLERGLFVRTIFSYSSVFYSNFISSFQQCDAAIVTTSYAYESVSLDALKQWFTDMQKEVHVLGPLLPPGYGTKTQSGEEGTSVDIEKFLGEMLVKHGKRSVFFVRCFRFFCVVTFIHVFFPGFLWLYPLATSSGIRRRIDRSPD